MAKVTGEVKSRLERLKSLIEKHNHLYHTLDKPEISDEAYDSLVRELHDIENQHPELKSKTSPTNRVGGEPLKEFVKVTHATRQWSYDDAFTFEDLKDWDKKLRSMI